LNFVTYSIISYKIYSILLYLQFFISNILDFVTYFIINYKIYSVLLYLQFSIFNILNYIAYLLTLYNILRYCKNLDNIIDLNIY